MVTNLHLHQLKPHQFHGMHQILLPNQPTSQGPHLDLHAAAQPAHQVLPVHPVLMVTMVHQELKESQVTMELKEKQLLVHQDHLGMACRDHQDQRENEEHQVMMVVMVSQV